MSKLRIAGITENSIVDGPGIRYVLWCQGCEHHCPGCHNPQTHDKQGGIDVEILELVSTIHALSYHSGITLSGGDPMMQAESLIELLKQCQNINVWCYTGYTWEECLQDPQKKELLQYIDVLVDGRFMKEKMPGGMWKGSHNQRIIDVPQSLKEKHVVLLDF